MVVLILMRKKSSESCDAQKEPGQDIYGVNPNSIGNPYCGENFLDRV